MLYECITKVLWKYSLCKVFPFVLSCLNHHCPHSEYVRLKTFVVCLWTFPSVQKERNCYNSSVTYSDISQASLWSGSRYIAQVRAMIGPSDYRGIPSDWSEPVEWTTPLGNVPFIHWVKPNGYSLLCMNVLFAVMMITFLFGLEENQISSMTHTKQQK